MITLCSLYCRINLDRNLESLIRTSYFFQELSSRFRCKSIKQVFSYTQVREQFNKARPRINFINVLSTTYTPADPKRVKRHWWLNSIFTLSGCTSIKAVRRMLMKLSPRENGKRIKSGGSGIYYDLQARDAMNLDSSDLGLS